MKFEKFVKSLASTGTIYNCKNGDRWLASQSVFMLIPPTIRSITAAEIADMPEYIEKIITGIGHTDPATLIAAYMPIPDGGIKDCQREFANKTGEIRCKIANDDYSLIEKSDLLEIKYSFDIDDSEYKAKALLVKTYPVVPDEDDELVGIIFPIII